MYASLIFQKSTWSYMTNAPDSTLGMFYDMFSFLCPSLGTREAAHLTKQASYQSLPRRILQNMGMGDENKRLSLEHSQKAPTFRRLSVHRPSALETSSEPNVNLRLTLK